MADLNLTAFHEAGHGVAMYRLFPGLPFDRISVVADDESLGWLLTLVDTRAVNSSFDDEEEVEDIYLREATFYCAGFASCVVAGYSEEEAALGCDTDFETAGHRKEVACKLALELMRREENSRAVQLIANKLLELSVIDYDHICVLMEMADGTCSDKEYQQYLELRAGV